MNPHARFTRCIFGWERWLLQSVGHDYFAESFKRNFISYFLYAFVAFTVVAEIYTFFNYDGIEKIAAFHTFLMSLQGIMKIYNSRYADDFRWCICLIEDIYKEQIATKSRERLAHFHTFALFTEIFFKATFASFLLPVIAFLLYPIYMYFTHGEIVTIFPIYLPLIDESTVIGYSITTLYHLTLFILATIGFCTLEFLLAIVIVNTLLFAKLISWDLQQMNADLEEGESGMSTVKLRFKNVFLMHQEMDQYLKRIYRMSFQMFFVQIGTNSCGAIFALYALLAMHYLPAYGAVFLPISQIFIACLLGFCVELTHDQIHESAMYLNWNQLPIKEQLFYKFFVSRSQTPILLSIGGFAPLNMNSCVKVYVRIYSITMLIYTTMCE